VAFAIVLWYGLNHPLVNDGVKEYQSYLANINEGWRYRLTLVNSCLITTWIPALIYKAIGHGQLFIFRLIPALFYPLMPAFTYLIAKRYVKTSYAVVAALVILFSSFFIYFPDIGRVGVALGFMAGMLWALLERNLLWAIVFVILIVFSHYGTAMISLATLVLTLGIYLLWKRRILKQYAIVLIVLAVLILGWHFGIAGYSGETMGSIFSHRPIVDDPSLYNSTDFFDPRSRDPAVQEAIGLNLSELPIPAKIELVANWLVVGMITVGLYCVLKRKNIEAQFKLMALSLFALILLTIAVPWLSTYYLSMRVFFTASILLAVCFPIGAEHIAGKLHLPVSGVIGLVLILYALSTSGLIYRPFGLIKTFIVS